VPELEADQANWRCAFEITAARRSTVGYGHGVDSLQALVLAVEGLRVELAKIGIVTWEFGSELGETGLTKYIAPIFGLQFTRRVEAKVEAEFVANTRRLAAPLKRRVAHALKRHAGDVKAAAESLGMDVKTLRSLLYSFQVISRQ
jgi:hypothetical protein